MWIHFWSNLKTQKCCFRILWKSHFCDIFILKLKFACPQRQQPSAVSLQSCHYVEPNTVHLIWSELQRDSHICNTGIHRLHSCGVGAGVKQRGVLKGAASSCHVFICIKQEFRVLCANQERSLQQEVVGNCEINPCESVMKTDSAGIVLPGLGPDDPLCWFWF